MVTNQGLVSVIMPAYNHEKYVQEAIQSVIEQTYKPIELIIIDDGSKDSTWAKINEMKTQCEERFVRVVFETQENKGTCLTLNKLLQIAQGEYIQLLASDDKFSPISTQVLVEFLSEHPDYALAVGRNDIFDGDSVICYWDENRHNVYDKDKAKYQSFTDFLTRKVNFYSSEFGSYEKLLKENHIPNGYVIRKSIFEKTGYFTPEAPLEDYWLMLQIAKYAKMKYIDKVTFYYRWHGANTVTQGDRVGILGHKTKQYEIEQVKKSTNSPVKTILEKYLAAKHKKLYFKIPFLIELYKEKFDSKKELILKLFTHKFVIARKIK